MSISAFSSAVSGMRGATLRLEAVASNVANAATPGYEPVSVRQVAGSGGGVETEMVARADGPPRPSVDGLATLPGVDMATQMTDLLQASVQYKAALKVATVASGMERSAVDLLR
jgi:flagellar basal body rod protein FlgC